VQPFPQLSFGPSALLFLLFGFRVYEAMGDEGEPSDRLDGQQEMAPFSAEQLAWIDRLIVARQQASGVASGSRPSEPERSGGGVSAPTSGTQTSDSSTSGVLPTTASRPGKFVSSAQLDSSSLSTCCMNKLLSWSTGLLRGRVTA